MIFDQSRKHRLHRFYLALLLRFDPEAAAVIVFNVYVNVIIFRIRLTVVEPPVPEAEISVFVIVIYSGAEIIDAVLIPLYALVLENCSLSEHPQRRDSDITDNAKQLILTADTILKCFPPVIHPTGSGSP